jgi:hypothetical protein
VATTSPTDVWAVGYRCGVASCALGGFGERTLIEHRTATGWHVLAGPNPGTGGDRLNAVAAVSPTDAWAVGDWFDEGVYLHQPLIEHWDGTRWNAVPLPPMRGLDVHMSDVLALSASDVWAVGHGCVGGCGGGPKIRPVVLHDRGGRWRLVRTAPLHAVDSSLEGLAPFKGSVSAVGWRSKTRNSPSRPLAEARIATWWKVQRTPRAADSLFGADAAPRTAMWAVGDRMVRGAFRPSILRHTASGWRSVAAPSPAGGTSFLSQVAVLSRGNAWAVGPSVAGAFLAHWNGSRWIKALAR